MEHYHYKGFCIFEYQMGFGQTWEGTPFHPNPRRRPWTEYRIQRGAIRLGIALSAERAADLIDEFWEKHPKILEAEWERMQQRFGGPGAPSLH